MINNPDASTLVLGGLQRGEKATVTAVVDDGESLGDAQASTVARRLLELGFIPGARVEIIARMWPSYDPIAVRVGGSTFALRRQEANVIHVRRDPGGH